MMQEGVNLLYSAKEHTSKETDSFFFAVSTLAEHTALLTQIFVEAQCAEIRHPLSF